MIQIIRLASNISVFRDHDWCIMPVSGNALELFTDITLTHHSSLRMGTFVNTRSTTVMRRKISLDGGLVSPDALYVLNDQSVRRTGMSLTYVSR